MSANITLLVSGFGGGLMTLQEGVALAMEKSTEELIFWLGRTPDDRLGWKPAESGRAALNLAAECVVVAENWTRYLSDLKFPEMFDSADFVRRLNSYNTREEVVDGLRMSSAAFADLVRRLPDDLLAAEFKTPWSTAPVGVWIQHVAEHNQYHTGQICYIQTLYGDLDFE